MRKVLTIVLILLCLNCFSFIMARIVLCLNGGTAAKFERAKVGKTGDAMTYLIAGNLNQPLTAFKFLKPELSGALTYAQFRMMGWNAQATAENIAKEVKDRNFAKVNVYTISLGDHVGRYLEEYLGGECELQIVAINPCTDVSFLRKPLDVLLKIGSPIFEAVCHGLGWLSAIPLIPAPEGNHYSLMLLADQHWSIAYDHPQHLIENTIGVICSRLKLDDETGKNDNDGLLENAAIRSYFWRGVEAADEMLVITIPTSHGDTLNYDYEYLFGVQQILRKS